MPPLGLIAVAGVVGVGKTTLATHLAQILNGHLTHEEYAENPFLARQLTGDQDAALAAELYFLLSRSRQLHQETITRQKITICDYIFEKNRIFAGFSLTDHQMSIYNEVERTVRSQIAEPQAVVFLRDSAANCLARIHSRGLDYEQKITTDWLTQLAQAYETLFANWQTCPLIVIDCSKTDLRHPENCQKIAEKIYCQS